MPKDVAVSGRQGLLSHPMHRRDAIVGGMLAAITGASLALRPRRMAEPLTQDGLRHLVPERIGEYRFLTTAGLVLPPDDETSRTLYDDVLTRVYVAPDLPPVMALFAYGSVQNLNLELHRPEKCYPEQGFAISSQTRLAMDFGPVRVQASQITAKRNDYTEEVLYWTRIGNFFPEDRIAQSLYITKQNFSGWMPDGLLVRLSVAGLDPQAARRQMFRFSAALAAQVPDAGRRIMFGPGV